MTSCRQYSQNFCHCSGLESQSLKYFGLEPFANIFFVAFLGTEKSFTPSSGGMLIFFPAMDRASPAFFRLMGRLMYAHRTDGSYHSSWTVGIPNTYSSMSFSKL